MAFDYDAIVVGTGFGGCVAAIELAVNQRKKVLLLERGVWWYSPEVPLPPRIKGHPEEPVQFWPRPNHTEGLIHLLSVVQSNSRLERTRRIYPRAATRSRTATYDRRRAASIPPRCPCGWSGRRWWCWPPARWAAPRC
ncbi:MAG: NAD(P)-binding protein [Pseudonocardiaceae bacterium]